MIFRFSIFQNYHILIHRSIVGQVFWYQLLITKNLGYGARIPYYFAIDKDKNFTLTSGIYASEHPIFIGEYHQAFKDSEFIANFGYTEGYKNTTDTKQQGSKRHLFAKYLKNFRKE